MIAQTSTAREAQMGRRWWSLGKATEFWEEVVNGVWQETPELRDQKYKATDRESPVPSFIRGICLWISASAAHTTSVCCTFPGTSQRCLPPFPASPVARCRDLSGRA
ncbi:hypothetical protein WJX72_007106 [[Myrmecia] bisecta]|uniref:Acetyl-coenzyme A synthetase N-terminal domain-containing protein n=1 Tax=[Myrmecia] bisecta TaxID=41462 RepID=A0AAW1R6N9_9CHLO